ncbi:MAG: hypothetical protein IKX20_08995 [Paludibacteraceae bacterium]|nr:hypothetical protein [Paludibacteraceae bacterium]
MSKPQYQQIMDLLGLQEHNLFEIAYNKIVYFTSVLSALFRKESVLDERTFLLRSIRRMTNLMRSIYVIFKSTKDRASMMILARSVIDLNATICFLFEHVKDKDERALRLLLFYLDGVRTRLKLSQEPLKKRDPKYISEEEYNATLDQINAAKEADISAVQELEIRIKKNPLFPKMHHSIMENASWKYKKLGDKHSYSWMDLYEIAVGEKNMAQFELEYFSHYVHGVAISDFQFPSINKTNPVFALNICCSILNHLESIIKVWFSGEYVELEEAHKKHLVNSLLENMPPETLEAYLKSLDMVEN